jgi:uncharacterized membrane protein
MTAPLPGMKRQAPSPEADDPPLALARQLTLFVYVMHAVTSVTLVTFFVAICVNYSRRHRVAGTIYESHFDWQIRTFWYSLLYFVLGAVTLIWGIARAWGEGGGGTGMIILGMLLLIFNLCWHFYRVIRGLMCWSDRRPMPFHPIPFHG